MFGEKRISQQYRKTSKYLITSYAAMGFIFNPPSSPICLVSLRSKHIINTKLNSFLQLPIYEHHQ